MNHLFRVRRALENLGADALLVSSEFNQRYLSDFRFSDGYLLVTGQEAFLLTDSRYVEAAQQALTDFTVLSLRSGETMVQRLSDLIAEKKIFRLAMEDASLSCAAYRIFSDAFQGCTLLSGGSALLSSLRSVKTAEELERIAAAQQITDRAFEHILNFITPNVTEREVALELEFFMRRNGAEACAFSTIAVSGRASSLPHGEPRDCRLNDGFLTMDFGASLNGYCSDMTRTVVIGKADDDMKKLYQTVLSAQKAALDVICEGISCREADAAARTVIEQAGFGDCFGHSLGHGVGVLIHESPSLSPKAPADAVLKRGNVVTVEPGIYLPGKYGCRIEDMIAIDCDGSVRNFTKSPKELIEL